MEDNTGLHPSIVVISSSNHTDGRLSLSLDNISRPGPAAPEFMPSRSAAKLATGAVYP